MITRKQYLENYSTQGTAAHRAYYSQFVDDDVLRVVESQFTAARLKKSFQSDEHFNNIPLQWDWLAQATRYMVERNLREHEDFWSLGTGVCILKEAARQIVESAE